MEGSGLGSGRMSPGFYTFNGFKAGEIKNKDQAEINRKSAGEIINDDLENVSNSSDEDNKD